MAPGKVAAGNRFIFSDASGNAPTITYTADNQTKSAGAANPTLAYTTSGYIDADTVLNAFTGIPLLSTLIDGTTNGGVYANAITVSTNTLANNLGYQFTFDHGDFTVTGSLTAPPTPAPAPITVPHIPTAEPTTSVVQTVAQSTETTATIESSSVDCLVTDGGSGGCIVH